jgi:hypothetical protein
MGINNDFQDEAPLPCLGNEQPPEQEKVRSNTHGIEATLTTTSTSLPSTTSTHFTSSPKPT